MLRVIQPAGCLDGWDNLTHFLVRAYGWSLEGLLGTLPYRDLI